MRRGDREMRSITTFCLILSRSPISLAPHSQPRTSLLAITVTFDMVIMRKKKPGHAGSV